MTEQRKQNITYLLGAGASAFAVPTIKYFNLFLEHFKIAIKNELPNVDNTNHAEKIESYLALIDKITGFATIDTWARKLFLSESSTYRDLKTLITVFLGYCQLGSKGHLPDFFRDGTLMTKLNLMPNDSEKQQLNRIHQTPLDPRYDLFLGSILQKPNLQGLVFFPSNINVISWNYDSQFETSLASFSQNGIKREDGTACLPIKLNGTANLTVTRHQDTNKHELLFKFLEEVNDNKDNFQNILTILSGGMGNFQSISSNLRFAWEMGNDVIQKSNEILLNTDILVVIGYTFPSFNQEVERKIFKGVEKIRKVYYQVPENEYTGLLERLERTMSNGYNPPRYFDGKSETSKRYQDVVFKNIPDLNQFYIPNEYYS